MLRTESIIIIRNMVYLLTFMYLLLWNVQINLRRNF